MRHFQHIAIVTDFCMQIPTLAIPHGRIIPINFQIDRLPVLNLMKTHLPFQTVGPLYGFIAIILACKHGKRKYS